MVDREDAHMTMPERHTRRDHGGVVFGAILLLVGGYYLLDQTIGLNLPELNWDRIWPVILIVIGAAVLYGAWTRNRAT
jgi:phage shock protein C